MRIGIGVTTYNRPECLKKCTDQIYKHTDKSNLVFYIARDTDEDRKGVAARKNECLRALKDCDYIFLFDDDCWPIKDGWVDFFIGSGENHLLFLNEKFHRPRYYVHTDKVKYFNDCGGVFMFMTKAAIEKAGAFDEKFAGWGFEHANYSIRILGASDKYPMLYQTSEYLYSADYSNPYHESSISNKEKAKYFDLNFPKFKEPIKNIYLPL